MSALSLTEEFAESAKRYRDTDEETALQMLLTKFSVLMRHTVTDAADKDAVAKELFDCGMTILQDSVLKRSPSSISESIPEILSRLFAPLLRPECASHIPSHAAADLAAATLDLIRKGEAVTRDDFTLANRFEFQRHDSYLQGISKLAETTLTYADKFREALDQSVTNVTTNNPVVASKPLVLTRNNGAATP